MFMPAYVPPAPPPEVPTTTLHLSPPGWDCPMVVALAKQMQIEGRKLEFVVHSQDYNCEVYVVGADADVEEYEQLIAEVLKTSLPKE